MAFACQSPANLKASLWGVGSGPGLWAAGCAIFEEAFFFTLLRVLSSFFVVAACVTMSDSLIRRCFVSCRIVSLSEAERFVKVDCIRSADGRLFSVRKILCAYNSDSRDARMYIEAERVPEQAMVAFMEGFGITSVNVDSFGLDDWRSASASAVASVRECSQRAGYGLLESGVAGMSGSAQDDGDYHSSGGGPKGDNLLNIIIFSELRLFFVICRAWFGEKS
jgi:hypothetical protein